MKIELKGTLYIVQEIPIYGRIGYYEDEGNLYVKNGLARDYSNFLNRIKDIDPLSWVVEYKIIGKESIKLIKGEKPKYSQDVKRKFFLKAISRLNGDDEFLYDMQKDEDHLNSYNVFEKKEEAISFVRESIRKQIYSNNGVVESNKKTISKLMETLKTTIEYSKENEIILGKILKHVDNIIND